MPKRFLFIILACASLTGCANVTGLPPATIEALAKDQATSCVNVQTMYGNIKWYRTLQSGVSVKCDSEKMEVHDSTIGAFEPKAPLMK